MKLQREAIPTAVKFLQFLFMKYPTLILSLFISHFCLSQSQALDISFSSINEGKQLIIQDTISCYFDDLSKMDIALQIQDIPDIWENYGDIQCRYLYQRFLQDQVLTWQSKEREYWQSILKTCEVYLDGILDIIPEIKLVKISNDIYGPHIFFTRQSNIFIPKSNISGEFKDEHIEIMLHEIFHILSRYNCELREKCYNLIGFKPLNKPLLLSESLQQKLLHNPDGTYRDYAIRLQSKNDHIWVVPLLIMKDYDKKKDYFYHLDFRLFSIKEETQYFEIVDQLDQISNPFMTSFHQQIGNNTNYIIHPDEILADNFSLALINKVKNESHLFTKEGLSLMEQILLLFK